MKKEPKTILTVTGIIAGLAVAGLTVSYIKRKKAERDNLLNFIDDEYYYDDVDLSNKKDD